MFKLSMLSKGFKGYKPSAYHANRKAKAPSIESAEPIAVGDHVKYGRTPPVTVVAGPITRRTRDAIYIFDVNTGRIVAANPNRVERI